MSFVYQRTIGKIWFQLTLLRQGGNMAFCVYSLFYFNWMSCFLVASSVALDWPRIKSTVEPRLNEVPRDWGNLFVSIESSLYQTPRFNEFSKKQPKFSLHRGTQWLLYKTQHSRVWTRRTVKSCLRKITVHINFFLVCLFGIHLSSHVGNYSLHRDIFYNCTSGLYSL